MVRTVVCCSLFFSLCAASAVVKFKVDPPTFSTSYKASGFLRLPYAEIVEPFDVFYDGPNKRSRIDYYNGLTKTFQRGDIGSYGVSYKVAFMTTDSVNNKLSCFLVNGTQDAPFGPQTIFPDTTGFTVVGVDIIDGQACEKWQEVIVNGEKTSTYTLWVNSATLKPVRYEMMGYDSLLGSHYDKYILDYTDYQPETIFPDGIFTPGNISCTGFPGPGADHYITLNPMQEFVHHIDEHTKTMFMQFKEKHSKKYVHKEEHANRENIFRQNIRYINSKNRAGLPYQMSINHLADRSDSELKMLRGFRRTKNYPGGLPFNKTEFAGMQIPDQFDWRLYGAVTPVKDQAVCGSCWSFGTTGTIEGAYFVKTKKLLRLSQQELIDCSWGEGNNGCDGGEDFRSYDWIMKKGGITTEDQYGQYLAVDGNCKANLVKPEVQLSGYVNVTPYDQDALRIAIATKGPISVGIDAAHKSLSFYANGVYYEPACGNKPDDLDHAVLAVGYGTLDGEPYWLVKNSWSTYWGNDGYVLMSQKDNNCGVATSPTYPIIA
ncbi:digestive cysteine proteinase 2-like [Pomacea canaliculata]|uniref:digestive cysteine proteinase 2-like n=1 Tax=Pomacea canaliculata TaxID=400727 RepID=UPI000D73FA3F|nr:digestive cysteine proteinase 2-like [Pomacea canaliculata]